MTCHSKHLEGMAPNLVDIFWEFSESLGYCRKKSGVEIENLKFTLVE